MRFNGTDADGTRIIGVGITLPTYQKLLEGNMQVVDLRALGIPKAKLVIVAGRTEQEITKHLQNTINSRTNVVVDPRLIIPKAEG